MFAASVRGTPLLISDLSTGVKWRCIGDFVTLFNELLGPCFAGGIIKDGDDRCALFHCDRADVVLWDRYAIAPFRRRRRMMRIVASGRVMPPVAGSGMV